MKDMALKHEPGAVILKEGRFRFNSDNFWKKTYDALIKAADGDFGSAVDAMLKSSDAETPEHKAFQLVFNALYHACVGILTDRNAPDQLQLLGKIERAGLASTAFYHDLGIKLGSGEYAIDKSFFEKPQSHPLLKAVQAEYTAFLRDTLTISENQAAALAAVLPNRFVYELFHEWGRADYSAVKAHFDNIFFDVLKKQSAHEMRHANLLRRFAKPAFNDPRVTLAEMYIEPEFLVHGRCIPEEHKENFEQAQNAKGESLHFFRHKQHHDLHEYFLAWLRGRDALGLNGEAERLLVLLGHPGQGKTSFSLRAADQLLREYPGEVESVYLVRLRDVTAVENLLSEPLKTLREQPGVRLPDTDRLPESEMQNSILLLDGLDELYMNKGLNLDQIQDFLRRLRQDLKNFPVPSLRIVLTSRTNYLKLDAHRDDDYLVLHLAEFSLDQQLEWLRRHSQYHKDLRLTPEKLEAIHQTDNKQYEKIRELVRQPILLQMIVTADVDVDEKANSARIYDLLFTRLIRRDWSDDKQLPKYTNLNEKDLRRFLRTLATHIFQKPEGQEYARRTDFEEPDSKLNIVMNELAGKMDMEQLPLKDFARNLLVSAYFQEVERATEEKRRAGDHEDYAYEFLHKSLQEYLVAEHIWEECSWFFLKKDQYNRFEVQTAEQVMTKIHPLFAPKVLTDEIAEYLREIIRNDTTTDKVALKARLKYFLPELLEQSFLWEHKARRNEPSALRKMLGNFFGYWTLASGLVVYHAVDPRKEMEFEAMREQENLIPLNTQAYFTDLLVALRRFANRKMHLQHSDLRGADLRGAGLIEADLRETDLRGVDLRGAGLRGADIRGTDLREADLRGAYLSGADLSGADLSGGYLRGANLRKAIFRQTDLIGADLIGADLRGAYFDSANLRGADFRGADLRRTDFFKADLRGADFRGADLQGAILQDEIWNAANFENANLEGVIGLETAIGVEKANFKGTIYEGKFSKEK